MRLMMIKKLPNTMTTPCTTGKSLPNTLCNATRPMPGQAKTCSTTTVPEIKAAASKPKCVSGGISEFRKACFQTTQLLLTPLALANLTYSESRTSSIEERTKRKEDADAADRVFTELMGEEVAPRKAFIQAYATSVRNLDV